MVGASDVNGDRRLDLVWHHATRGDVAVWFMAGRVLLDAVQVNESLPDTNWRIVAVTDLDRDGAPDFIWQNMSTGQLAAWMIDGALVRFGAALISFGFHPGHELENCGSAIGISVTLTGKTNSP